MRITRGLVVSSLCLALVLPPVSLGAEPVAPRNGSRLQGTAAIDRRDRVVGAAVTVREPGDPSRVYLTSTDGSGVFRLEDLPNGEYQVRLERSGFDTVVKERIQVKYPFRAVVEVTMPRSAETVLARDGSGGAVGEGSLTIQGRIREREGEPVGEVRVRLIHPQGKLDPRFVETDGEGNFLIDDLAAGEWIVDLDAVGFLPLRVRLDFRVDSRLEVALVRQPADYEPSPLELMPPEQPSPPPGFLEAPIEPIDGEA